VIRGALLLTAALVPAVAASASAADVAIGIPARYFLPSSVQVVVGDTVSWHNGDHDTHNLVAVDGEFDSGLLGMGATFDHAFDTAGDRPYLCTIHPSMTGDVDVVPIALSGPGAPPTAGDRFALDGRAPVGSGPLTLERAATPDGPFTDVAAVPAGPDGAFTIPLTADATAAWRVTGAPGASPAVTVPVAPRLRLAVKAHLTRSLVVLSVRTDPVRPGETVSLQLYSRERFAWLPAGRARLDDSGASTFSVRRGLRREARVVYARDGATVHSRPIRLWRVRA
jgi:plastocyanin